MKKMDHDQLLTVYGGATGGGHWYCSMLAGGLLGSPVAGLTPVIPHLYDDLGLSFPLSNYKLKVDAEKPEIE